MKRNMLVLTQLMIVVLFTLPNASGDDFGTTRLRLAGSGSLSLIMGECAKEFNQKNPNKSIVVIGGHTSDGFIRLFGGAAEIAMASRKINESEKKEAERKGMRLTEKLVGHAILAILVPPSNPINELTIDQLRKIFNGEHKNWSELSGSDQPIEPVVVDDPKSGGSVQFKDDVMGGKPFPPGCKTAETFVVLTRLVAITTGSIGFCSTRYLEALRRQGKRDSVKTLSLKKDSSSPSRAPVMSTSGESSYPLMRPYYLYWDGNANMPLINEFVDSCKSEE